MRVFSVPFHFEKKKTDNVLVSYTIFLIPKQRATFSNSSDAYKSNHTQSSTSVQTDRSVVDPFNCIDEYTWDGDQDHALLSTMSDGACNDEQQSDDNLILAGGTKFSHIMPIMSSQSALKYNGNQYQDALLQVVTYVFSNDIRRHRPTMSKDFVFSMQ